MTTIEAVLEYDDSVMRDPSAISEPPFTREGEAINLTGFRMLRRGKSYQFIGAISDVRNHSGIDALYPLRGMPPNVHGITLNVLDTYLTRGWLTLEEIEASLVHQGINRAELGLEVDLLLEMMAYLEKRLGKNRVRLVFEIGG